MKAKTEKITSFAAHSKQVKCLKIGAKSGRVMVTGGDDFKVNLWAIGKPTTILSLSGHVTPIESVSMDWPEELVVAGSQSGSIKLWDLEQAKVIRTLLGHKSAVKCVEFHPFGEFFASGSSDMAIKLWVRQVNERMSGERDAFKLITVIWIKLIVFRLPLMVAG
jgi:katanin p80 WD40 repeat-containing subunit B1